MTCTHVLDPSLARAAVSEGYCPTCRERLAENLRCACCGWRWSEWTLTLMDSLVERKVLRMGHRWGA